MAYEIINPESMGQPKGWNNGMLAPVGGRILFIAGQTARDATGVVPDVGFVDQFGLALDNVLSVLREAGGEPQHVGRMTVFVTDVDAYRNGLAELGAIWRARMGRNFPAMALLGVSELVDARGMVEIEATAVLPPAPSLQEPDDRVHIA